MTVIRGATTIAEDSADEIRSAVKELLEQIENMNSIRRDEILSIVFSSTSDIHSYYPAKAAREAGFESCSLFSAQEPEIEGGLGLCIRVMLFVEKNIPPRHVYLRGARLLRKDLSGKMNIAIDGPAGSGKSTIAKLLAKDYHILYLDTGAMYRACALKALRSGVDPDSEAQVCDLMRTLALTVEYADGCQRTLLDGTDVSDELRTPEVSMAASSISRHECVRSKMVEKQREIAAKLSCVLDGRDIGTCVLTQGCVIFIVCPYTPAVILLACIFYCLIILVVSLVKRHDHKHTFSESFDVGFQCLLQVPFIRYNTVGQVVLFMVCYHKHSFVLIAYPADQLL